MHLAVLLTWFCIHFPEPGQQPHSWSLFTGNVVALAQPRSQGFLPGKKGLGTRLEVRPGIGLAEAWQGKYRPVGAPKIKINYWPSGHPHKIFRLLSSRERLQTFTKLHCPSAAGNHMRQRNKPWQFFQIG